MAMYINGYNLTDFFAGKIRITYGKVEEVGSNYVIAKGVLSHVGEQNWYTNAHSNGWLEFRPLNPISLKGGKTYTLSFDITLLEMIDGKTSFTAAASNFGGSNIYILKNTLDRQHVIIKKTFKSDSELSNTENTFYITLNSLHVKIENIMLVEGEEEKPYDNGRIRVRPVMPLLPKEYQEVEYVESTGTQYIDTGVNLIEDLFFDIKCKHNSAGGLFGRYPASNSSIVIWQLISANKLVFGYGYNQGSSEYIRYEEQEAYDIHTVKFADYKVIIDNKVVAENQTAKLKAMDEPFYLFRQSSIYGYGRIYYAKLYIGNTIIRNFIPCYRKSDSEVGLYDTVNGKFYGNDGTGEFLKGANKTILQKCNIFIGERNPNNLIPFPYYSKPSNLSSAGIEVAINADGSVTFNGTATKECSFVWYLGGWDADDGIELKAGHYTYYGVTNGSSKTYYSQAYVNGKAMQPVQAVSPVTITVNDGDHLNRFTMFIKTGAVFDNITIYPMLVEGETIKPYFVPQKM